MKEGELVRFFLIRAKGPETEPVVPGNGNQLSERALHFFQVGRFSELHCPKRGINVAT